MEAEKRTRLEAAGIDVGSALERFMGSDALLERFLKKFLEDANYGALKAALDAGDREGAITASHSLKGVCGNLSMTELFDLFTRQVQLLREEKDAQAAALMPDITRAYDRVSRAIQEGFGCRPRDGGGDGSSSTCGPTFWSCWPFWSSGWCVTMCCGWIC